MQLNFILKKRSMHSFIDIQAKLQTQKNISRNDLNKKLFRSLK